MIPIEMVILFLEIVIIISIWVKKVTIFTIIQNWKGAKIMGEWRGRTPRAKINRLLMEYEINHDLYSVDANKYLYGFYVERLINVYNYGLVQGRELIKMICRCAFNDSSLTDNEAIVIMETCLDPRLDNILMEVNFNEGWN